MGDIRVRDLDPAVVAELKNQARRHGRSWQQELKAVLTEAALRPRRELANHLQEFHDEMRATHGVLADSTPAIRAERDQWG